MSSSHFPIPPEGDGETSPPRRRRQAGAFLVAASALALLCAAVGRAEDRVVIPAEDADLKLSIEQALRDVEAGPVARALAFFERTLSSPPPALVRVTEPPPEMAAGDDSLDESIFPRAAGALRGTPAAGRRFLAPEILLRSAMESLPAEAVEACRERQRSAAAELLRRFEESGDALALERLDREFFLSSEGAAAREILGDRWFEEGRFTRAFLAYRGLAPDPSAGGGLPGRLRLKMLLSLRLAGDEAGYRVLRARLPGPGAEPAATDELEALAERLGEDVDIPRIEDRHVAPPPSRWGGELRAGPSPSLPASVLALSWDSWLWSSDGGIVEPADYSLNDPPFGSEIARLRLPVSFPAVDYPFTPLLDEGRVFLSGVFSFYLLDGRPRAGRILREIHKPDPARLRQTQRFGERSDSAHYTVTLWKKKHDPSWRPPPSFPDEILIGQYISHFIEVADYMGYEVRGEIPTRSLVAFDVRSGEELWRTLPWESAAGERQEPGGGAAAAQRGAAPTGGRRRGLPPAGFEDPLRPVSSPADISFTSPAVVRAGRVFVSGWKQAGFVDSLVRALDLVTGETIWETHVCSSQMELTMFGEIAREPFASHIVEDDGVLYCQTNQGAVAALDAASGRMLWLTTYDSLEMQSTRGPSARWRALYWGNHPPLLVGSMLVVTPRDSKHLLALDTGRGPDGPSAGGRVLWSFNNSGGDLRDLLGYRDRRLFFTGRAGVASLDLTAMTDERRFPPGAGPRKELMAGRFRRGSIPAAGALTQSGVVYADARQLNLVDWDLGLPRALLLEDFPPSRHGRYHYPGRVHVAEDLVLVISNRMLSAFGPPSQ